MKKTQYSNGVSFRKVAGPFIIPKGRYFRAKIAKDLSAHDIINTAQDYFTSGRYGRHDFELLQDESVDIVQVTLMPNKYYWNQLLEMSAVHGYHLLSQVTGPLFWLTVRSYELPKISGVVFATDPINMLPNGNRNNEIRPQFFLWRLGVIAVNGLRTVNLVDCSTGIVNGYWAFRSRP